MSTVVEESMLEHYKYIIDVKTEELAQLYNSVRYREQELEQLLDTLNEMTVILDERSS